MAGHISDSGSVSWCTPEKIWKPVQQFLGGIKLDPCSNSGSKVPASSNWIYPEHDGLVDPWKDKVYCNPPFGTSWANKETGQILIPKEYKDLDPKLKPNFKRQTIKMWAEKAASEWENNEIHSVLLTPASVGSKMFQDVFFKRASYICFIKGRLKFEGAKMSCTMDTALTYFGGVGFDWFLKNFGHLGYCIVI